MRRKSTRLAAAVGGLVLAAGALSAGTANAASATAGGGDVGALACYDHSRAYTKPAGSASYPSSGWLTTTTNCRDISIRPNESRYVRVCFNPSSRPAYCQSSFTYVRAGQWNIVATSVLNGTKFNFHFQYTTRSTGRWAA
ncbi:hypothetical protein [Streptomyces alkaliterrae]|uniref:Secreted protein n=1 Tax=Streptomyces alkaliterrae TaxID=2213162 RepID=A0A5P0YT26_9ACTN|nr:hypothetical protein [Streptomyces alkaliterrae]MBB1256681.1 hypothetical protein [Streptomyces alkaliterrae]MBB1258953.1 hypothetical protein [Streptomyces alkaliterrae]MQS03466.1 hypothetical protein [Streptomyces alkaliterrae]